MTQILLSHELIADLIIECYPFISPRTSVKTTISSDSPVYPIIEYLIQTHLKDDERLRRIKQIELETGSFFSRKEGREVTSSTAQIDRYCGVKLPPHSPNSDNILLHLQALEYLVGRFPNADVRADNTSLFSGTAVSIENQNGVISLESRLRFPKRFFPHGLEIDGQTIFDANLKSTLQGDKTYQSLLFTPEGEQLHFPFTKQRLKHLVELHNSSIGLVIEKAEKQNIYDETYRFDSDQIHEGISPRITAVDYWDARVKDMMDSAWHITSLMNLPALKGRVSVE